jgi:hypothetical protein
MELPFTVVFEPPSRAELRALLRMRRTWVAGVLVALAIGTPVLIATVGHTEAAASGVGVPLEVTSRPTGAGVWVDGRERGRTPLEVQVEPGTHRVLLKAHDAQDGQYAVQVGGQPAALAAVLWRSQPTLAHVRPSLPGAALADVRLLADGELALSVSLPPGHQMQAWRLDPQSGVLEPLLTDVTSTRLSVAPDGEHVAFVGYDVGPPGPGADAPGAGSARPSVLWLVYGEHLGSIAGWRPSLAPGEQLLDASWSPRADRLLVVTGATLPGGAARSRLWLVDADGQQGREVLALPSEIATGSEAWSPDGQHVALVAHAGMVNALCLVDVDGGFRYVADLDSSAAAPLAYLPATWAGDSQRLVFVAPHQHPPGVPFGWMRSDAQHALYIASATDPTPLLVGDTDVDFAAWREDGQLVGLGRLGIDRALAVRLLDGSASTQQLLELPLRPAANYAALWDLDRARVLLVSPTQSGGVDYWLAMFGLEGER